MLILEGLQRLNVIGPKSRNPDDLYTPVTATKIEIKPPAPPKAQLSTVDENDIDSNRNSTLQQRAEALAHLSTLQPSYVHDEIDAILNKQLQLRRDKTAQLENIPVIHRVFYSLEKSDIFNIPPPTIAPVPLQKI